jgi:hypothetical protein
MASPRRAVYEAMLARCAAGADIAAIAREVGLETEAALTFTMEADRSDLPAWIGSFAHRLETFPPQVPSADAGRPDQCQ